MAVKVKFLATRKTLEWDNSFDNILEFAEENGIELESECGIGVCGTCKVKLVEGEVEMEQEDGLEDSDRDENMILPCVAIPVTDIVIDA